MAASAPLGYPLFAMDAVQALEQGICHAVSTLLLVPAGMDRTREGRALAAPLLSSDEEGQALVLRGVHPDLVELVPPEGKERIGIDQVREAIRQGQFAPIEGERKVCLLPRAEALTPEAANALLKALEEPPRDLLFLLLAEGTADVLPTILSRSEIVRLRPLSREELLERFVAAGYDEDEGRYLVALVRKEEELASFLAARVDIRALRTAEEEHSRLAGVEPLVKMVTSSSPIERREGILSLLERLAKGEKGLRVGAARELAKEGRERILAFLEDLLYLTSDLLRARFSLSLYPEERLAALGERVSLEAVLRFAAATGRARRAVEAYTPAEAVLLSLFVRAGRLA